VDVGPPAVSTIQAEDVGSHATLPVAASQEQPTEPSRYPLIPPDRSPVEPPPAPEPAPEPITAVSVQVPVTDAKARPAEDPPLLAALRCYLQHRPSEAVVLMERYDRLNQELLLALVPLAVRLTEGSLRDAPPQEVGAVLSQLQSLTVPLRPLAPLVIEKMCLCQRILGFGNYDKLPDEHAFRPGDEIELYVELENFTSKLQGGFFVTRLASTIEIRDFNNQCVWQLPFDDPDPPDVSRSRRHDLYYRYKFQIDRPLRPGCYTLWIKVTDEETGRSASRSLDFRVTNIPPRNS
jgi:hypothetical protein